MVSVLIPAHNDAAGLARLLPQLAGLDVTVIANGCTDDTAEVARAAGVRVIELAEASKSAALNAGDAVATGFPRIYLDADVLVTAESIRALVTTFDDPRVYAATLRRRLAVAGRPLALRGYFAIQARLPLYRRALFGRGVVAVSEAGRARFDTFGGLIADDLFLDRLFTDAEKAVADGDSVVDTARGTAELVGRLSRVRAGTAQQGATGSRTAWLRLAAPRPWLWPAALCYAGITLAAERRRRTTPTTWKVAR
ncbi:glycosyltransferase [Longispora sp. K20-0274]|uniref:glycosyltransferase n=1 Tax=Longispora sp. K20-0274 TaxID=3088255 RepID=UPI00399B3623